MDTLQREAGLFGEEGCGMIAFDNYGGQRNLKWDGAMTWLLRCPDDRGDCFGKLYSSSSGIGATPGTLLSLES